MVGEGPSAPILEPGGGPEEDSSRACLVSKFSKGCGVEKGPGPS